MLQTTSRSVFVPPTSYPACPEHYAAWKLHWQSPRFALSGSLYKHWLQLKGSASIYQSFWKTSLAEKINKMRRRRLTTQGGRVLHPPTRATTATRAPASSSRVDFWSLWAEINILKYKHIAIYWRIKVSGSFIHLPVYYWVLENVGKVYRLRHCSWAHPLLVTLV